MTLGKTKVTAPIMVVSMLLLVLFDSPAKGATLDDFYLEKFRSHASATKSLPASTSSAPAVQDRCRTWLRHDLRRDWKKLSLETQTTLSKVLASRPALQGAASLVSSGGHFRINYATSGSDAPSTDLPVSQVAAVFEEVYAAYVGMGYTPAPTVNGAPYDVYLKNIGTTENAFGYAETDSPSTSTSYTSYIILDNDFSAAEFGGQISNYTPLKALQITAAHEYHHAIQFGYNLFFQSWFAEATSTWMEDEVYDQVNQLYAYLPQYMRNTNSSLDIEPDVTTGGGYGRWIFTRHLAERHAPTVIREIWQRLGTMPAPQDYSDIPMLPVIDTVLTGKGSSLDEEFFQFGRKLYNRTWTSHTEDISQIYQHPLLPVNTPYSTFPVTEATVPAPAVTMPHYSIAYFFFQPSVTAPATLSIGVTQQPQMRTAGFRKTTGNVISEYLPDADGWIAISSFSATDTAQAALLIANGSAMDSQSASFSASGLVNQILSVTTSGTGTGSVNSIPSGIACASGSNAGCSASFLEGTPVGLTATASAGSTFGGWSGACTGTEDCTVTLDGARSVTATFTLAPPAYIGGTSPSGYPTLQAAYDAAKEGDVIKMKEGVFAGSLLAARPVKIYIKGGYNASYTGTSAETAIDGSILVRGGSLRMEKVKVR